MIDTYNRVYNWNAKRDNLYFDSELEIRMLEEEMQELKDAVRDNDKVKIADAFGDIAFVVLGSLAKFAHANNVSGYEILNAIISANETKSTEKVNGKIVKPVEFIPPDEIIRKILNK